MDRITLAGILPPAFVRARGFWTVNPFFPSPSLSDSSSFSQPLPMGNFKLHYVAYAV